MASNRSFSSQMSRSHLGATRALGYALTLGTPEAWGQLLNVLAARLTEEERASIAFVTLKAMRPDQAEAVAGAALPVGAGRPIPPLFSFMDEAAFWADMAEPEELDAYCLATFSAMSPRRKAEFLKFVNRRRAA